MIERTKGSDGRSPRQSARLDAHNVAGLIAAARSLGLPASDRARYANIYPGQSMGLPLLILISDPLPSANDRRTRPRAA